MYARVKAICQPGIHSIDKLDVCVHVQIAFLMLNSADTHLRWIFQPTGCIAVLRLQDLILASHSMQGPEPVLGLVAVHSCHGCCELTQL